jgi:hypothetical protein
MQKCGPFRASGLDELKPPMLALEEQQAKAAPGLWPDEDARAVWHAHVAQAARPDALALALHCLLDRVNVTARAFAAAAAALATAKAGGGGVAGGAEAVAAKHPAALAEGGAAEGAPVVAEDKAPRAVAEVLEANADGMEEDRQHLQHPRQNEEEIPGQASLLPPPQQPPAELAPDRDPLAVTAQRATEREDAAKEPESRGALQPAASSSADDAGQNVAVAAAKEDVVAGSGNEEQNDDGSTISSRQPEHDQDLQLGKDGEQVRASSGELGNGAWRRRGEARADDQQ